ncbi:AraC family transcriptional regulator [Umezawaea sp. Da 62-37]|uniref:helix-turn-helix transcriptional regulator n=1 Tax=Umezawaea sp. Da 62-37 TaxID=3075927 RepID=UPI0028F7034C|nr:AraC family transcriptional regulator [Umezawaea sp. Da 62-37]WNV90461.1 AraC family transcriptional regulator [Umezawaea sp. Da 62-37]
MLSFLDLATGPGFKVVDVDCRDDHRGWSTERPREDVRLVLVRRGGFRRRARGVSTDLDRTVGYLGAPDEEEHFAHPAGGDRCTSIILTPALWRTLAGDAPRLAGTPLYVDGGLDLAHRRLLAAGRSADIGYAAADRVVGLMTEAVRRVVVTTTPDAGRTVGGDRTLVARARGVIDADHPAAAGLIPLATLLDVSPYRLSRAFTRELGVSLTRYRNRVRVTRALDRIEAGEPSLATLATDLGFADQAHLCRTVREHLGHTPTALRGMLT